MATAILGIFIGDEPELVYIFIIFCIIGFSASFRKKNSLDRKMKKNIDSENIDPVIQKYYENMEMCNKVHLETQQELSRQSNISENYNSNLKSIMTEFEYQFYSKLLPLEENYKIIPQFQLSIAIGKEGIHYRIDFAIYNKEFNELLLLIELNDSTHRYKPRAQRDKIVKLLCEKYHIKSLTFYSRYKNDQNYVLNRIYHAINSSYESYNTK